MWKSLPPPPHPTMSKRPISLLFVHTKFLYEIFSFEKYFILDIVHILISALVFFKRVIVINQQIITELVAFFFSFFFRLEAIYLQVFNHTALVYSIFKVTAIFLLIQCMQFFNGRESVHGVLLLVYICTAVGIHLLRSGGIDSAKPVTFRCLCNIALR